MAFEEFGLEVDSKPVVWSADYYSHLANTVGGGKPKMRYHFTGLGAPEGAATHPDTARVWPTPTKRDSVVPADEAAGMLLVDGLQVRLRAAGAAGVADPLSQHSVLCQLCQPRQPCHLS
tara:strand:- start:88 stop:444 length:357 start_codon:yes stop_codon:yes gene_type:complete